MASLLIDKKCKEWIQVDDHKKIKDLLEEIYKSIANNYQKILKLQMSLLSQISYH